MDDPLFAALFAEDPREPLTVSELNSDIKGALERQFSNVWVEGEITNFHSATSGHWYFSLTDGDSILRAVCFKGQNFRVRFKPSNGLLVRVRGRITTYEARGEYQIIVESLEPVGEGALSVAFEQIKAKLAAEGLFDNELKRPLPAFPRRIGVVTSPTGAALQDILTVLERRARSIGVVIVPTLVQGERAGEQIAEAISLANQFNEQADDSTSIDVLIVGRGGGSAEDLWAFNEEQVARAIRGSRIPVISAVGHEVDFTIADFVADLRAPTPSAAAEIVARAEAEVIEQLRRSSAELVRSMNMRMLVARTEVQALAMAPVFAEFPSSLRERRYRIDELISIAEDSIGSQLHKSLEKLREVVIRLSPVGLASKVGENKRRLGVIDQRTITAGSELTRRRHQMLENAMARLDSMSPLKVLERGYSITQAKDGSIIRDAARVASGDEVRIRLAIGELGATVTEVHEVG